MAGGKEDVLSFLFLFQTLAYPVAAVVAVAGGGGGASAFLKELRFAVLSPDLPAKSDFLSAILQGSVRQCSRCSLLLTTTTVVSVNPTQ